VFVTSTISLERFSSSQLLGFSFSQYTINKQCTNSIRDLNIIAILSIFGLDLTIHRPNSCHCAIDTKNPILHRCLAKSVANWK